MGEIDERYKYNNQEDANEFISNFLDELLDIWMSTKIL